MATAREELAENELEWLELDEKKEQLAQGG